MWFKGYSTGVPKPGMQVRSIKLDKAKLLISRFLKDENEAKEEVKGLKKELFEIKKKLSHLMLVLPSKQLKKESRK